MKLTLAMLVGDSAKTLPTVLRSVRDQIHSWVLLGDTRWPECKTIAQHELAGIPGTFGYVTFEDFSQARNSVLHMARSHARPDDYLLMVDADEPLSGRIPRLTKPVYYVQHVDQDSSQEWTFPKIVRADAEVYYVGKAHEYLEHANYESDTLDRSVYFTMPFGSGTNPERLASTLELLRNETDSRSIFYLARTYESLGRIDEAIATYQRRAQLFIGWDQEQFFAAYQAGVLLMPRDVDLAIEWLLKAHYFRPSRIEPLVLLKQCLTWKGRQLARSTDNLFVNRALESEI
jgi:tetratricopeptide (TPR) repeat protein